MPVAIRLSAIVSCPSAVVRCAPAIVCGAPAVVCGAEPVVGGLRGVWLRGATVASIASLRRSVALVGRPIASLRSQVALVSSGVTPAVRR
jgi:hypothetical protein